MDLKSMCFRFDRLVSGFNSVESLIVFRDHGSKRCWIFGEVEEAQGGEDVVNQQGGSIWHSSIRPLPKYVNVAPPMVDDKKSKRKDHGKKPLYSHHSPKKARQEGPRAGLSNVE